MEYIDGIRIVSRKEALTETYRYFGLNYDDPLIVTKAIEYLKQAKQQSTINAFREVIFGFRSLWAAVSNHWQSADYYEWICTYSQFFLYIIENINELDIEYEIKYLLLGEKLLDDMTSVVSGLDAVAKIFDLRGFDFFLSYYFCGEVKEEVLLKYSGDRLCKVMKYVGRVEESEQISLEISDRANGLRSVQQDGILESLRLEGERAWFQYLGVENWCMLPDKARSELIDSYSMQKMIEYKVLKMWTPVVLAITKVAEAELNYALVKPWQEFFASAEFQEPDSASKKQQKKIERRRQLFNSVKKAVTTGPELSLGQIQVLLEHFDDELMDDCTNVFIEIRLVFGDLLPDFLDTLTRIKNCFLARESEMNIVELRNASAHPRPDSISIDWGASVAWLCQLLGTPPLELLTNIRVLKRLSNIVLERRKE